MNKDSRKLADKKLAQLVNDSHTLRSKVLRCNLSSSEYRADVIALLALTNELEQLTR